MSDRSDKRPLDPYLWSLMWRLNLTLPESLYLYRGRQRWGRGEEQLIRIFFVTSIGLRKWRARTC
jgi:hypothetical protein